MSNIKLRIICLALLATFTAPQQAYGAAALEVIQFFASWCGPCKEETRINNILHNEYQGRGVQFRGINEDNVPALGKEFADTTGMSYPWVHDPGHAMAASMGANNKTPSTVIKKNGQIVQVINGSVTESTLRSIIEQHLR